MLELYEAGYEVKYLDTALGLTRQMLERFEDKKEGGLFCTSLDVEEVLLRQKEVQDDALPSGNSIAMLNMLRLARITGDTILEERSEKIAEVFSSEVAQYPLVHTQFLAALDFSLGPSYEIVIAGKVEDKDTQEMIKTLRKNFLPNKVVLLMPLSTGLPEIVKIAPFLS